MSVQQRRLAAILAADVVGFSRLMEADEAGTLARLKHLRLEVIEPLIRDHQGRVVGSAGDSLLVEFSSASDAVRCAAEVQARLASSNAPLPEDRRMVFRVGVNLGDVIAEGDTIFGDGVNIAARLEKLAKPGGVTLARNVYDQVKGKVPFGFAYTGEHTVHNLLEPVRAYELLAAADAQGERREAPAKPAVADGRSIAVLPFANMSGDPDQEFFADGITEDILTALSRFRHLFVISRNSSFVYKGRSVNAKEVANELKVQYVLEGSVRRAGNRLRVTAQLIDAESDRHVWAERYDRELADIFQIQDELTEAIVAILPGRIDAANRARVERKSIENLQAYECVLAGKLLHHRSKREANGKALEYLDRAIVLEPNYAHAHAWRACVLGQQWGNGWCSDRQATQAEIRASLQRALSLDDNDSDTHRILAALSITLNDFDKAIYHQQRALDLNPNDDLIVVQQGELLTWTGKAEEGVGWIQRAMRLNPYHPERFWNHLGRAYFVARRYVEAADAFRRITAPSRDHHAFLAAIHARLGKVDAATHHVGEALKADPAFRAANHLDTQHYTISGDREHHTESLALAGLP